jgi:peptidoglycan L-alanyl-D-glutamate endopeptidase CwlK
MPHFGPTSKEKLSTCHPLLKRLMECVIEEVDFKITYGRRSAAEQNRLYKCGKSKKRAFESKHNREPSLAVDIAPYPIDWKNLKRFYYLAGVVMGIANILRIPIRWGGDWDMDTDLDDQTFNDLGHFELVDQ